MLYGRWGPLHALPVCPDICFYIYIHSEILLSYLLAYVGNLGSVLAREVSNQV